MQNAKNSSKYSIQTFSFKGVNLYVIKTKQSYILIDTGFSSMRYKIEKALNTNGCCSKKLKLIIITHGDSDHSGNAKYFQNKYNVPIAMHASDLGMVEKGNMQHNRKLNPDKSLVYFRVLKLFNHQGNFETFHPNILLKHNDSLLTYGLNGIVLSLPGHSKGSIGILTSQGDLFCGDLFTNIGRAQFHSLIDNYQDAQASYDLISTYNTHMVYPGHGIPFSLNDLKINTI